MTPLRPRYARIDRLVNELLSRAEMKGPPIPVEAIAEMAGATIHLEQFEEDVSGVLIRGDSHCVIGVQKMHSEGRRRFTIAHELGHLLLHDGKPIRVDKAFRVNWRKDSSSKPRDVEEIEANAFAAKLLMPTDMIEQAHGESSFEVEDETEVVRLAKLFGVSNQAMNFRLNQLFNRSILSE
jgi:Zn-dependent peptidase ImmA (M78 family)